MSTNRAREQARADVAISYAEIERLRSLIGKPHPYAVNDYAVEKYEGEWTLFAKDSTNPLAYFPNENQARTVVAHINQNLGDLRARLSAAEEALEEIAAIPARKVALYDQYAARESGKAKAAAFRRDAQTCDDIEREIRLKIAALAAAKENK